MSHCQIVKCFNLSDVEESSETKVLQTTPDPRKSEWGDTDIVRCFVRAAKVLGMKHHNSNQNTSKGTSHQNPEDNEDN